MSLPETLGSGSENFLQAKDFQGKSCIATINEEPRLVPSSFKNPDGSMRVSVRTVVKLPDGKLKIWTMNNTTYKAIRKDFGGTPKDWIGKKIRLWKFQQMINEKLVDVIYGDLNLQGPAPK